MGTQVLADDATTRPYPPGERRFRQPFNRDRDFEMESREAEAFMREHSPNRFEMYEALPDDAPQKRMVKRFITGRYRQLMDERRQDPATFDLTLKQLTLDDEIFAIAQASRQLAPDSPDREKLKGELKAAMGEWVDNSMALRKRWIERVEKAVEREKSRLDADTSRRSAYIDERVEKRLDAKGDSDRDDFRPEMGMPPMPPHEMRR